MGNEITWKNKIRVGRSLFVSSRPLKPGDDDDPAYVVNICSAKAHVKVRMNTWKIDISILSQVWNLSSVGELWRLKLRRECWSI